MAKANFQGVAQKRQVLTARPQPWIKAGGEDVVPPAANQDDLYWAALVKEEQIDGRDKVGPVFAHQKVRAMSAVANYKKTAVVSASRSVGDNSRGQNMVIRMMQECGYTAGVVPEVSQSLHKKTIN